MQAILPFRSASFELDAAIAARILSLNPAIYEEIQFGNTHSAEVLDRLLAQLAELRDLVHAGDDAARARFRERFLRSREAFGPQALADGNYAYERVGYLLADPGLYCSLIVTNQTAYAIYKYAPEHSHWLEPLLSGQAWGATWMTETHGGSDLPDRKKSVDVRIMRRNAQPMPSTTAK